MTELAIVFGVYVLSTTYLLWFLFRRFDRIEEEHRLERGELQDRVMALSSKPESLAAIGRSETESEVTYVGEESPWHSEAE
jgi:hypothetical protein